MGAYELQVGDYQYPGESGAFDALRKIPFLDQVVLAFQKALAQVAALPEVQGDCFRVTEETCPEVYRLYRRAIQRLCMKPGWEPPLFIKSQFEYNACAYAGETCVVIHSSMLTDFNPEELLFVIGHEIGHMKSGHSVYSYMAENIRMLVGNIPMIGQEAAFGLFFALHNWYRYMELTADRAGAIAAGSTQAAVRGLGKLMGQDDQLPFIDFSLDNILSQNDAFEMENQDWITKMACVWAISSSDHPWTVTRIKAIHQWEESGAFRQLMDRMEGET